MMVKKTRARTTSEPKVARLSTGLGLLGAHVVIGHPDGAILSPTTRGRASHEAAIAFHRVLGRATLILVSGHFGFYGLAWAMDGGAKLFWDETLQVCHHGPRVTKLPWEGPSGRAAWASRTFSGFWPGASGFYWASAFYMVRRRSYALFMATHQLHWLWWFFACLHWPGALAFVAPALIFFVADCARRLVSERTVRCAVVRHGPKITTVLVPCPGYTVRQLTGGVFRLRCFRISMMWHPFPSPARRDAGRARGPDPRLRREGRQGGHVDECLVSPGGVGAVHRTRVPRADHRSHESYSKRPARRRAAGRC